MDDAQKRSNPKTSDPKTRKQQQIGSRRIDSQINDSFTSFSGADAEASLKAISSDLAPSHVRGLPSDNDKGQRRSKKEQKGKPEQKGKSEQESKKSSKQLPADELTIEDSSLGVRHTARGLTPIVPDDSSVSFAEGLKAIRADTVQELEQLTAQFTIDHVERKTREWQEKRGTKIWDRDGIGDSDQKICAPEADEETDAASLDTSTVAKVEPLPYVEYPSENLPDGWTNIWMCYGNGSSQQFLIDNHCRVVEYVDITGSVWRSMDGWKFTLAGTNVTAHGVFHIAPDTVRFFNLQENSVVKYASDGSRSTGRLGLAVRADIERNYARADFFGKRMEIDADKAKTAIMDASKTGYEALAAALADALGRRDRGSWEKFIESQVTDMIRHGYRMELGPDNPSFVHHADIVQRFPNSHKFMAILVSLASIPGRRDAIMAMIKEEKADGDVKGYSVKFPGAKKIEKIGMLTYAEKMIGATSKLGYLYPAVLEKAYGQYRNERPLLIKKERLPADAAGTGNNDNLAFEMLTGHKAWIIDTSRQNSTKNAAARAQTAYVLKEALRRGINEKLVMIAGIKDGSTNPDYEFLRKNHTYAVIEYKDDTGVRLRDPLGAPKPEFWISVEEFNKQFHYLCVEQMTKA